MTFTKVAWCLVPRQWTKAHIRVDSRTTRCGLRIPDCVFNMSEGHEADDLEICKNCTLNLTPVH